MTTQTTLNDLNTADLNDAITGIEQEPRLGRHLIYKNIVLIKRVRRHSINIAQRLLGNRQCSVCQKKVMKFRPLPKYFLNNYKKYGYKIPLTETLNLDQYSCPHCNSSDRDRLYAIYLKHFVKNRLHENTTFSMLDLAPGKNLSRFIVSEFSGLPRFHYRTADLCQEDVDDKVDVTDMSIYKDEQFDFFICSHILEHVKDDRKAMRELLRILKNGGKGILMVPINVEIKEIDEDPNCIDIEERWRRFGQDDHVRAYSKQGFIDRIIEAGFELEQCNIDTFGTEFFFKHGIHPISVLYVVNKPQKASS